MKVASAQCEYEVTVVTGPPCFPDPNISIGLEGINDLGQACGWQAICGQVTGRRPLVWTEELGIILLPLPEGATRGVANDINNVIGSDGFGQVACTLSFTGEGNRACVYDDGFWSVLDSESSDGLTEAFAINDDGWVAGYRDTSQGRKAFRWRNVELEELASPMADGAVAIDINPDSYGAGGFGALTGSGLGFLWQDESAISISPVEGGSSSEARALNTNDIVTGQSLIPVKSGSVPRRSWRYEAGVLIDLGGFADTHRNIAEDINDADQIVGTCFNINGAETPYLWQHDELFRLRDLFELPPEVLGFANVKAINNRGQIVGMSGGASHGLILTPIVPLGDVNLDCKVDGDDLAIVLRDWGPDRLGDIADIVASATFQPPGDGIVDGADLAVVLGNWTVSVNASTPKQRR